MDTYESHTEFPRKSLGHRFVQPLSAHKVFAIGESDNLRLCLPPFAGIQFLWTR